MRIHFCGPTVKALQAHLQWAVKWNKGSVLCRSGVLLDYSQHIAIPDIAVKWKVSPATVYNWLKAFILNGVDSLDCRYGGGRPSKLDLAQKKQLTAWLDAGPEAIGFATACWSNLLVQEFTWSRRGQTPTIATSGKRRGYKLFGAIEFFSGRVFYEVSANKFNSQSYEQFIKHILERISELLFLVQEERVIIPAQRCKSFSGSSRADCKYINYQPTRPTIIRLNIYGAKANDGLRTTNISPSLPS